MRKFSAVPNQGREACNLKCVTLVRVEAATGQAALQIGQGEEIV